MTFPSVPTVNPWTDFETVNAVDMYERITALLNAIQAVLPQTGIGGGPIPAGNSFVILTQVYPTPFPTTPTTVVVTLFDAEGIPRTVQAFNHTATSFDYQLSFCDGRTLGSDYGCRISWAAWP